MDAVGSSRGADSENGIDIACVVGGDARPGIDRSRVRAVVDRIVYRKRGTVVVRDGHALRSIGMEIVVGDKNSRTLHCNPWLIGATCRRRRIDRRSAAGIAPRGKRGRVCGGALVNVAAAEHRTM